MVENNLAAPCGIYCGACRQYLVLKKGQLKKRGFKLGCKGCRVRNKKCKWIRKDCSAMKRGDFEFCCECDNLPCQGLKELDEIYQERYNVNMVDNLKRIEEIGVEKWLQEQKKLYTCPQCAGEICVHDEECYDCGLKINPNKK